jgi:hypothetical protein
VVDSAGEELEVRGDTDRWDRPAASGRERRGSWAARRMGRRRNGPAVEKEKGGEVGHGVGEGGWFVCFFFFFQILFKSFSNLFKSNLFTKFSNFFTNIFKTFSQLF